MCVRVPIAALHGGSLASQHPRDCVPASGSVRAPSRSDVSSDTAPDVFCILMLHSDAFRLYAMFNVMFYRVFGTVSFNCARQCILLNNSGRLTCRGLP